MHRFSRMHLSPEVAISRLDVIDLEEKSKVAEGIAVLAVIDQRRDYLAAGYSCTLHYCMDRLHMSQDRALRRIQVARVALKFPDLFECLADGRLSVATASVLAPSLEPNSAAELLAAAAFRSRHELVRLLAARSQASTEPAGEPDGRPLVQDASGSYAPGHMNSLSDLCAPPSNNPPSASPAPADVDKSRRGRVTISAVGGYEVRLSITDEEHQILRQAQALLGHAVPSSDPALVYARAMKHYLAHLEKQRLGVKRTKPAEPTSDAQSASPAPAHANEPRGRGIPKALSRQVWERDGGRCSFVGTDGHRCEATQRIELDHITPIAKGGGTTADNLRLLCRPHNQFEAERVFGKDHVAHKREIAQRERARAKAATSAARAKAREAAKAQVKAQKAAKQERSGDVISALRGLGFTVAEANRGAELTDAMPGASLEARVRLALTELTRAVAMRGERRARCTA